MHQLAEFVLTNAKVRKIQKEANQKVGESKVIQSVQSFRRLKIKGKVPIGKVFEFF